MSANVLSAIAVGALVGVLSLAQSKPQLAAERTGDTAQIRAHIDAIFRAYETKDRETVKRTHVADWRGFLSSSPHIIRGIDEYMTVADASLSAPGTFTHEITEFDVVYYGDIAIVNYVAALQWPGSGGSNKLRVIDIYGKQSGEWNQLASQVAQHPESTAAAQERLVELSGPAREELLAAREAVWRAWFAHDEKQLLALLPEETLAFDGAQADVQKREQIVAGSAAFATSGGRLVKIEFPRTDIQVYGSVAILYTTYVFETDGPEGRKTTSGRGTEMFVRRAGKWVNTGWHVDDAS